MASNQQPEKKKQKIEEEEEALLEKKDFDLPLPDPAKVEDDKDEEGEDEEEEYSELENDEDNSDLDKRRPDFGCDTSDEDVDDERYKEYKRTIRESQGFNVPPRPPGVKISYFGGPAIAYNFGELKVLAKAALVWYKEKKKEDRETYEVVKVERASQVADRGILYYITFIAHAVGANCDVTFRAKVLDGIHNVIEVDSCEIFSP